MILWCFYALLIYESFIFPCNCMKEPRKHCTFLFHGRRKSLRFGMTRGRKWWQDFIFRWTVPLRQATSACPFLWTCSRYKHIASGYKLWNAHSPPCPTKCCLYPSFPLCSAINSTQDTFMKMYDSPRSLWGCFLTEQLCLDNLSFIENDGPPGALVFLFWHSVLSSPGYYSAEFTVHRCIRKQTPSRRPEGLETKHSCSWRAAGPCRCFWGRTWSSWLLRYAWLHAKASTPTRGPSSLKGEPRRLRGLHRNMDSSVMGRWVVSMLYQRFISCFLWEFVCLYMWT